MSAPAESSDGSVSMNMNMVTTVMAFSVSAFFVLFVFTRLLCARIHLRAAAGDPAFPAFHVERGIRGLEPAVVTTFPTVKFGDASHRPAAQESQCTVCLEEYEAKDVVRVLPSCGHAFHVACIDAWLRQHSTCPVCRASLRASAAAMPPVYRAAVRAPPPFQVSASSSDRSAFQAEAAAATDLMDVPASRLEIVSDEPVSSGACRSAAPAAM